MDADKFEQTLKTMLDEFEKSGKSVDEFIQEKLAAGGCSDAAAFVAEMNSTFESIDKKYESLQKFKEQGRNRSEWLRQEVDEAAEGFTEEDTGKFLSSTIKVLNNEENDIPDENASYSALDAAFMIKDLDEALVKNTCRSLSSEEN